MGRKAVPERVWGGVVSYQEELSMRLMLKLGVIANKQAPVMMTDDNIGVMNIQFDLAYEEVYGCLPYGC